MGCLGLNSALDIRSFPSSDICIRDGTDVGMKVQGYALKFNKPSKPMPFIEYISPHAFDNTDLSQVLLVYGHEFNNILSRVDSDTLKITIDDTGLFFEATLPPTQLGRDTYENINFGNIKGCSFAVKIGQDSWDVKNGQTIHYIETVELLNELTLTPLPAYSETSVNIKRSLENFMKGREDLPDNQQQNPIEEFKSLLTGFLAKMNEHDDSSSVDGIDDGSPASSAEPDSDGEIQRSASSAASSAAEADSSATSTEPDSASSASSSTEPASPTKPASSSTAPQSHSDEPSSSAEPASSSSAPEPPKNKDDGKAKPADEGVKPMSKVLPAGGEPDQKEKNKVIQRSFESFLKAGQITREDPTVAAVTGGITLKDGSVIIPETILPVEHETYQYPRLAGLVRTVSVTTTTGKLPIFMNSTETLAEHVEFGKTDPSKFPEVKPVNWDLKTRTGNYVYSRDLIEDSEYNWQSDLAGRLQELRDNTDDSLIMIALTTGITPTKATDLLSSIKTALNVTLKPVDAQKAQIILSQTAYDYLDQLKDGFGRPLIQPDVTKAAGQTILGKTVVVVEDTLYPGAKAGDINVTIAPLQKAVIRFKKSEITGQFQDSYDIWYQILGIYLREDVVQARKDLIVNLTANPKA